MKTLLKFFPFMPAPKETGKLIWALVFYLIVPTLVSAVLGFVLGLTIILAPLAVIIGFVLGLYGLAGLIFAIMSYAGFDFEKKAE